MKKAVMDHAMAAELESPEYTPAATRRLFMDPEVYCALISVAVAHGVAKLLDKEERRKTITAKTQAMRDFFAEMAEGEMNEINGTPVLKMLDGQVNEEFGAWTPITTSLQGWVDLMKNIAQGLSTEAISDLAEACRVADSDLVTEELVERASAEFEAHVDHMCRMKYGEIDAGIEKTRADWHQEKQEMEPIMNARDSATSLPAIDGIINAAHKALAESKAPLCSEDVAKAITGTKRVTKAQIKEAEKQMKELHDLGILESNTRAGGVSFYSLTVAPVPVAEVCDLVQTGGESQTLAEPTKRQLTEAAEEDRNDFDLKYDGGNCSCHNSAPCGSCTHPGNPRNQADDESCWKTVSIVEPVAAIHIDLPDGPVAEYHNDDDKAVLDFAEKMRAKMAASRDKGRSGWNDKDEVSDFRLSCDLIQHAAKGNAGTFIDVANYAMMLEHRGASPEELKKAFYQISAENEASADMVVLSGSDPLFDHLAEIAQIAAEYLPGEEGQAVDGVRTMERLIDVRHAELIDLRNLLDSEKRVASSAISAVASFCERLGCDDLNGPAPALRAIDEMRKKIARLTDEATSTAELHKQITSLTTDLTNTRRALNDALNEADRMRTELAIERQARQALQEQINAAPAVAPKAYSIDCAGQVVVTGSKTGDSAIKAAERLAKKNGCAAKITAHVPFGTVNVVKGVEFKAAKAAA